MRRSLANMNSIRSLCGPVAIAVAWFSVPAAAQTPKTVAPYKIEFDPGRDVDALMQSPDGTKKGLFVRVRFNITLDGNSVGKLDGTYKIVIEEDGKRVKEVDLPQPIPVESISVMLALDTSGSMKEHNRMEQARDAAKVFLTKLPAKSDCGLILFDHLIRHKQPPIFERPPLLKEIYATPPRGGTAYLDATAEGIDMLRGTSRGRERAVVVMTDGVDLNSKKKIEDVIKQALAEPKVRVYTIGIGEPGKVEQVNTVLALDHSGSMTPPADDFDKDSKLVAMHRAAERFVDSMSPVGRCSIVPFSTKVDRVENFQPKARAAILKQSILRLQADGETALFDATYDAISLLDADGAKGKRAVIAMTDGIDNSSRRRVEEVIERAKEAKVPLYILGFGRPNELDDATMRRMAEETGGKYYHAKNKAALMDIFENLSIQLHDDGVDEVSLKKLAKDTGGLYYPVKNVSDLKLILEQVTKSIQREPYEIIFESPSPRGDGRLRDVTLKLVRRGPGGGGDQVLDERTGGYQVRGLVVAEMNPFVYLILLVIAGGLIALPGLLRRTA